MASIDYSSIYHKPQNSAMIRQLNAIDWGAHLYEINIKSYKITMKSYEITIKLHEISIKFHEITIKSY